MSPPRRSGIRDTAWPESKSRPLVHPIAPAVVYTSADLGEIDAIYDGETTGYTYAREGHPNADTLAAAIDALEGAEGGMITGSGMSAISMCLMGLLKSGDHVVGSQVLYGRSLRLLTEYLPALGIDATLVDPTDAEAIAAAFRPKTRLALVEVVSNPTIRLADMAAFRAGAAGVGALLAVDNTFTTPLGYQPLAEGADIVIHSVTKLLAGHSDVTLGYVAARDPDVAAAIEAAGATFGTTPSPFDCWLAERGVQTFELRYARAEANAAALAERLAGLPGVDRVFYPTRADHPDHNRAQALLGARGGHMVSFVLKGGRKEADAFVQAADVAFAPTLGDVATTLSNPPTSSHRALDAAALDALGIPPGFFRVSVGIEPEGLVSDRLEHAIRQVLGG